MPLPRKVRHDRTVKKIRLLLIEDNRLLREGLAAMLAVQEDIALIASSETANAAVRSAVRKPHVVLVDIGPRHPNSMRIIRLLKRVLPGARIVVMDLESVQGDLFEYVSEGVCGFILRDATFDVFLSTIRHVAAGGRVLPPSLTGTLFSQIVGQVARKWKHSASPSIRMTGREQEIVDLIADGMSNKQIAKRLSIAPDTVKGHVHNILEKLALHTRLEVASYAHGRKSRHPGTP